MTMTALLKLSLAAVIVLAAGALRPAYAQTVVEGLPNPPAASVALAKEIVTMKQANVMFAGAVPGLIAQVKDGILRSNLDKQKDLDEVALKLAKDLDGRQNEIGEGMAKIYASGFTEQELRDLVAFYKTPLGKKSLETEPRAMELSVSYMNLWAQKFSDEIGTRFKDEMKKRGKDI
jgi:hypothetical protein